MTEVLTPFPDAEKVAVALLYPVLDDDKKVVTATTTSLTPPMIRVTRTGGEDDYITDYPRIDVQCIAGSRAQSWDMAEQCRQIILAAGNTAPGGWLIDSARTVTPAQQIPDPNTDIRVVTATYVLALRRPRSSS